MNKGTAALITTAQCLSITSQLLAIGIEVGILAGGYYVWQKIKKELEEPEPQPVPVIVTNDISSPTKKVGWKQKWAKVKSIVKAVTE